MRMASITAAAACLAVASATLTSPVCASGDQACVQRHHAQSAWVAAFSAEATTPEQLWVSYGPTPDSLAVRWLTADRSAPSSLAWGLTASGLTTSASGTSESYTYGVYSSNLIHTVNIQGFPLNTTIFYRVGDSATGYSAVYSVTINPGVGAGPAFYPFTTAFVADVGESASANDTIAHVLAAAQTVNFVVINGDIS